MGTMSPLHVPWVGHMSTFLSISLDSLKGAEPKGQNVRRGQHVFIQLLFSNTHDLDSKHELLMPIPGQEAAHPRCRDRV